MIQAAPSSSGVRYTRAALSPASPLPKKEQISCLPSPGTKIKDRLRYFEAEKEKQKSSFESTASTSVLKAGRRNSLSDAPKPKAHSSTTPQRRGSLFASPRTVIPGPPLTESNDSSGMSNLRSESKKGFYRHSSGDSNSCSTTSVESLSDSSTNPAEMYGYDDTESPAQDYEDGNHRSADSSNVQVESPMQKYHRDLAVKNSRSKYRPASLSPKKRLENCLSGPSILDASQSARPATSRFKSSVTGLPPPPFNTANTPSKTPVASSKSSAIWSAPSTPKEPTPTPTSTHAVPTSSSSLMLSSVKSRIKMLNVDQASQASTSNISRFPIIPSTTNNSVYDSPTRSPNTPKVVMYLSPTITTPCAPEKSVCETPLSISSTPVKPVCGTPIQSAMKSPIRASCKIGRSITFSDELVLDLVTKEVIKKKPSKEECTEAVTKIQAVARGRQGRVKSRTLKRYFSLRKQLDEAEGKKQQELRMIREELDKKKKDLYERAQARSNMRHHDKSDKVEDNQAIIQSLRDDNSKIRTQISKMKSECKDLHAENSQFEKSLAVREDYLFKLNRHQEGALEENESLLKVESMFKAKADEQEETIEIRKQYASAETNMKMAYRKCMLKTADMFESGNDEFLKDLVSSAVIACFDNEEKIKSALASDDSKDTAKQTVADLDAMSTRRVLETVVEEDEDAQTQDNPKNDGDLDSDPSVEVVASPSPPSPSPKRPSPKSPSPKSPSPKSPRKPSPKTTPSPKKKCPGIPPSPRKKTCVM
jgi:hypothetical protein